MWGVIAYGFSQIALLDLIIYLGVGWQKYLYAVAFLGYWALSSALWFCLARLLTRLFNSLAAGWSSGFWLCILFLISKKGDSLRRRPQRYEVSIGDPAVGWFVSSFVYFALVQTAIFYPLVGSWYGYGIALPTVPLMTYMPFLNLITVMGWFEVLAALLFFQVAVARKKWLLALMAAAPFMFVVLADSRVIETFSLERLDPRRLFDLSARYAPCRDLIKLGTTCIDSETQDTRKILSPVVPRVKRLSHVRMNEWRPNARRGSRRYFVKNHTSMGPDSTYPEKIVIVSKCFYESQPYERAQEVCHALIDARQRCPQAELFILPESTFPFPLNEHLYALSMWFAHEPNAHIVIGSHYVEHQKLYNCAYVLHQGRIIHRYVKAALLPFFEEHVPFNFFLRSCHQLFLNGKTNFASAKTLQLAKTFQQDTDQLLCDLPLLGPTNNGEINFVSTKTLQQQIQQPLCELPLLGPTTIRICSELLWNMSTCSAPSTKRFIVCTLKTFSLGRRPQRYEVSVGDPGVIKKKPLIAMVNDSYYRFSYYPALFKLFATIQAKRFGYELFYCGWNNL